MGGVLVIGAIAAATAAAATGLQQLLLQKRPPLQTTSSANLLRRTARFDPDPLRRRQARLILASPAGTSAARKRWLLQGQGWGNQGSSQLLVPVVLKHQALSWRQLGQPTLANQRWQELLRRFPTAPPSADALYYLGNSGSSEHQTLLQRFPAHPAALAAAVDWHRREGGSQGGLHLARWGERWPGALPALLEACQSETPPLSPQERDLLAGAIAQQGALAAAKACLGDQPALSQRTNQRLGLAPAPEASPEQQAWEQIRQQLKERQWASAAEALRTQLASAQTPPLQARYGFWLGLVLAQLGEEQQAREAWQRVLADHPFGYYGWRASNRLGQAPQPLPQPREPQGGLLPAPIAELKQLGLHTEAWEHWRTWRGGSSPTQPLDLWREGTLRLAVGDRWSGLVQLDAAQRQGAAVGLAEQHRLEQARHPLAYQALLQDAARSHGIEPHLLQGLARQESRLTTTVQSAAGAVGLLQLMPSTAAELIEPAPDQQALQTPELSAELGARYLKQMLDAHNGSAWLALAAYNAGPGAVSNWINPSAEQLPELWVEMIPYPETRLYVKKVLGNRWSYALLANPGGT